MKRGKIAIGGLDDGAETASAQASPAPAQAERTRVADPDPMPTSQGSSPSGAERRTQSTPPPDDATPGSRSYDPPPRRPRSERKNAFELSAWLIEGVLGIAEEVRHNDLGLSEEFWVHAYAARREALLAARALIDTALEHCAEDDDANAKRSAARRQRGRVDINFD